MKLLFLLTASLYFNVNLQAQQQTTRCNDIKSYEKIVLDQINNDRTNMNFNYTQMPFFGPTVKLTFSNIKIGSMLLNRIISQQDGTQIQLVIANVFYTYTEKVENAVEERFNTTQEVAGGYTFSPDEDCIADHTGYAYIK